MDGPTDSDGSYHPRWMGGGTFKEMLLKFMWLPWWVGSHLTEALFPAGMLESWMNEKWFIPLRNQIWTIDRSMTAAEGRNRILSLPLFLVPLPLSLAIFLSSLLSFSLSVWPPLRSCATFPPHLSHHFIDQSCYMPVNRMSAPVCTERPQQRCCPPKPAMWRLSTKSHNQFQGLSCLFAWGANISKCSPSLTPLPPNLSL